MLCAKIPVIIFLVLILSNAIGFCSIIFQNSIALCSLCSKLNFPLNPSACPCRSSYSVPKYFILSCIILAIAASSVIDCINSFSAASPLCPNGVCPKSCAKATISASNSAFCLFNLYTSVLEIASIEHKS